MPAYLLATIKVTDPEVYQQYVAAVAPTIARFGGRYLVRGGNPGFPEGAWPQNRIVVLEFADRAAVEAWYRSPDYQAIVGLRLAASESRVAILDGYVPPA